MVSVGLVMVVVMLRVMVVVMLRVVVGPLSEMPFARERRAVTGSL